MIIKNHVVFLILSVTIALTNISFAQKQGQARIDSLLSELTNALPDTNKVNLFAALSYSYFPIDPDIGIKYGNEGLALAEKLKWKNGIALIYGHLGINYAVKSDNTTALEYFLKGLKYFEELGFKSNTATALGNIANVYMSESNYPKALEFHMKALRINEEVDNKKGIATNLSNIGLIYKNQSSYPEALKYFNHSLEINKELGNKKNMANNLAGIGMVYFLQKNYKDALGFYNNANILYEELGIKDGIANSFSYIGTIYSEQADYVKALDYIFKSLNLYKELKNKIGTSDAMSGISVIFLSVAKSDTAHYLLNGLFSGDKTKALQQAKLYSDSAIAIQAEINYLKSLNQSYKNLSEIQDLLGDSKNALESYKNYSTIADSVFNMEKDKKLIQTSMQYEFDKKEATNKVEQEKKDIRQRNVRNSITGGLAGALVFLVVVYRQRNKISKEKRRSDELLLNILPEEVAEELMAKGSAEAKQFDEVTVMFTDFKNFTQISEKLSPSELVNEIHACFKAFDEIIGKHSIEKIKTIGDSYMCAGGLPVANTSNAIDVVNAAMEIQQFMQQHLQQRKNENKEPFEIRIGIHSGPVVAGIVGVKKFAYDIWGDTVNIASRMESSGEAGKVNISGFTYELVKDKYNCVHRGKIQAKNKGEIDMYFVENNM